MYTLPFLKIDGLLSNFERMLQNGTASFFSPTQSLGLHQESEY